MPMIAEDPLITDHRGFRLAPLPIVGLKAVTTTARKIAVLFFNALRYGMDYVDPGTACYEEC